MFYRVIPKIPLQKTKESSTIRRLLDTMNDTMTEHSFEIYIESQIDRIDRKYMRNELTEEEYHNKMRELSIMSEEFYTKQKSPL